MHKFSVSFANNGAKLGTKEYAAVDAREALTQAKADGLKIAYVVGQRKGKVSLVYVVARLDDQLSLSWRNEQLR